MSGDPQLIDEERRRGRGARSNRVSRYDSLSSEVFDDGWETLGSLDGFETKVQIEQAKSIISSNDSPDLSFDQSINPYRGCEHGCIYCYARPTHAYVNAGVIFPRMAGVIFRHFRQQEGPRARWPSCCLASFP